MHASMLMDAESQRYFAHHLKNTGIKITVFSQDLLGKQNLQNYDLILIAEQHLPFLNRGNKTTPTIALIENKQNILALKKKGVFETLTPTASKTEIVLKIRSCLEFKMLISSQKKPEQSCREHRLVNESAAMRAVSTLIEQFSKSDASVLIWGETGTGKELCAEALHQSSNRNSRKLMKVNCAALAEELLESELFGHEKGAFTGAFEKRIGRFEQAHRGSIFLDEIAEINLRIQAKLLRVLSGEGFERIGSNSTVKSDVRIICATNKDLRKMIQQGSFREDLYFRLNILSLKLPPLRDRPEDILPLCNLFLTRFSQKHIKISDNAKQQLLKHSWPGNVRELKNLAERTVLLLSQEQNEIHSFSIEKEQIHQAEEMVPGTKLNLELTERNLILKALHQSQWVQRNAAALLGLSPRALNYRLKRLGITHPDWKRNNQ
jgi:transcriptional regulator with GAF, ATPase, and Fis domain